MAGNTEGQNVMTQGRIVWCSGDTPFTGKLKTDQNTKQVKTNAAGEQLVEYGFGLAIAKTELVQGKSGWDLWSAMHNQRSLLYPTNVPPSFAMKYKDGDGVDHNGTPFAQREGHAGHIIVAMTTTIKPKFFRFVNGAYEVINEGIKCGDYVQVQVNVKAHPPFGNGKPGLYINPNSVLFLAPGKEIINAPSAEQIFGAQPNMALPPGAVVDQGVPMGMPAATGPMGMPAPNMAPQMIAQQQMQAPAPNYGVIPPQYQPQQPAQAPAPQGFPQPNVAPVAQHYQQPAGGGLPPVPGVPGWPQQ